MFITQARLRRVWDALNFGPCCGALTLVKTSWYWMLCVNDQPYHTACTIGDGGETQSEALKYLERRLGIDPRDPKGLSLVDRWREEWARRRGVA